MTSNGNTTGAKGSRVNRKLLLGIVALIVVACAFFGAYKLLSPKPVAGAKTLTVAVSAAEGGAKSFTLHTDSAFLRGALEEVQLIEGEESAYGLFVTKVNGVAADAGKQEWWCVTKGGETLNTGVDTTPIADGDRYEITLKTGYDSF